MSAPDDNVGDLILVFIQKGVKLHQHSDALLDWNFPPALLSFNRVLKWTRVMCTLYINGRCAV
jgi:hypothetical protein